MHDLETRILELKQVQAQQMVELNVSAADILESISPASMLRSALTDVAQSPELRNNAIHTAIGIGAGFLGKKIYQGNSKNIFRKITGTAIEFLIANFVRKKIPEIQKKNLRHIHETSTNVF